MKTEKKPLNVLIGYRLKIARENGGYTQEEFAETLDVGVEHYRKVELGMYGLQRENMCCARSILMKYILRIIFEECVIIIE